MQIALSRFNNREADVLVIGGGINGSSAAQHLTAAGYSVILADKGDFASAATGRSTRILHWGIRYLAPEKTPWEFLRHPVSFLRKFRESSVLAREYREFRRDTPEYVTPYPVFVPFYKKSGVSGWQTDVAALLLGATRKSSLAKYKRHSGNKARELPVAEMLRDADDIQLMLEFEDCQFAWPERICIDALMAAEQMGAQIRNYTKVEELSHQDGRWRATLRDADGGATAQVSTKCVINTAGVWVDELIKMATTQRTGPIAPKAVAVKGIHIMVKLPSQFDGKIIVGRNRSNTQLSCIPFRGLHYIGPTEVPYSGNIEDVQPHEEDIRFLVNEANHFFPGIDLAVDDVRFAWAGVRPKTYHPAHPLGDPAGTASIHDMAAEGLPNFFTLTWGTINQHRLTARRLVEAVQRSTVPTGSKAELSYADSINLKAVRAGTDRQQHGQLDLPLLVDLARKEYPRSLIDLLFRRVDLGWGPFLSYTDLRDIAEAVAPILGWSDERVKAEVEGYVSYIRTYHACDIRAAAGPLCRASPRQDQLATTAEHFG